MRFLCDEIYATPVLCCIRGISWDDAWSYIQVLVDVLENYLLGEGGGLSCAWDVGNADESVVQDSFAGSSVPDAPVVYFYW